MYQKILALLNSKYKQFALIKEMLPSVARRIETAVSEESEIEAAVDAVQDELKFAQAQADRIRVLNDTVKSLQDSIKKPETKDENNNNPKPETPKPKNDVPEWAKALTESVATLSQGLTALQTEKAAQTNQQKLLAQLKENNVPEQFYKYHVKGKSFENDTEITDFANSLKADYDAFKQENANQGLSKVSNPLHADSKTQKGVSSAAQAFINLNKNQNEQSKQGA